MPRLEASKLALVIEGDAASREAAAAALGAQGFSVLALVPESDWFDQVLATAPDCLLLDQALCQQRGRGAIESIKRQGGLAETEIILWSADASFESRALGYALGADEWVARPYGIEELERSLSLLRRFELTFWGVRGTLPIPGRRTLQYGGNTSCLSLLIARDRRFVFDAGTGMKALSDEFARTTGGRFEGRILITHPHWDHLTTLPFFGPLYIPENHITIQGPAQGDRSIERLISEQMDGTFFPITVEAFKAEVDYQDLTEGTYCLDGVQFMAKRLRHPGYCLGYRVAHKGRSIAYVTDNELGPSDASSDDFQRDLIEFLRNVDVLVHDTTYFDEEYPSKVNWGHSSVGQVTRLAHQAGAKHLYLFHHDPDHGDTDIERKLEIAEALLADWNSSTRCHIAAERMLVRVDRL